MILREEQMAMFQQRAEVKFLNTVMEQLRTNHAATVRGVPVDKLRRRVEYGIERARGYGLTWENNLATFVILMFEIAPDFDNIPVFQKYLTDQNLRPDERIEPLLAETTDADWEDAVRASAGSKWHSVMS